MNVCSVSFVIAKDLREKPEIKSMHFLFSIVGDEDYSINEKREFVASNSSSKFTTEEGTSSPKNQTTQTSSLKGILD